MQPKWFKDEICEELEGACTYWKCAIDAMKTQPEWWAKCFAKMAEQEQDHATHLYKMFMDMYTDIEEPDGYMKGLMEGVMECFSKYMRKIEDHKTIYEMMWKKEEREELEAEEEEEMDEERSVYTPSSSTILTGIR